MADQSSSHAAGLFSLASEVRTMIYELAMPKEIEVSIEFDRKTAAVPDNGVMSLGKNCPRFIFTNRLICIETNYLFWQRVILCNDGHHNDKADQGSLIYLGRDQAALIKAIRIVPKPIELTLARPTRTKFLDWQECLEIGRRIFPNIETIEFKLYREVRHLGQIQYVFNSAETETDINQGFHLSMRKYCELWLFLRPCKEYPFGTIDDEFQVMHDRNPTCCSNLDALCESLSVSITLTNWHVIEDVKLYESEQVYKWARREAWVDVVVYANKDLAQIKLRRGRTISHTGALFVDTNQDVQVICGRRGQRQCERSPDRISDLCFRELEKYDLFRKFRQLSCTNTTCRKFSHEYTMYGLG